MLLTYYLSLIFVSLKYLVVILLLTGLLAQTFNRFLIVADYQLNKDYISKYLCENKYKPQLQCKGKCQMMKKLQAEEQKDQQNPERRSENKFEVIAFHNDKISITLSSQLTYSIYPEYHNNYLSRSVSAPFLPPRA